MLRALIAALAMCLAATAAVAAPCGLTGLYVGAAKSADGSSSEITLNLLCDGGRYRAQFFTLQGDFDGKDPVFADGRLKLSFDNGVALGAVDLAANGDALTGAINLGGDKGALTLTRKGEALAADAMTPRLDLTPAQWREDLHALATELPRRHANAFFALPKAEFDVEVAALDRRIDSANGDEMFVGLQQIVRSIGDGHTAINATDDRRVMPIEVTRFGDDFRITGVGPGLERALGARIIKIGGLPIGEVWKRVMTLAPRGELPELREGGALVYLARGYALHGLDVIPDRTRATYTLEDQAGHRFELEIHGLNSGEEVKLSAGAAQTALRFQKTDEPFWCEDLAARHAVYCGWRSYQDLGARARAMFAMIDAAKPDKLIIDMRDNGGGDNTVGYGFLVAPLKARPDINARGRLYVLVGPLTFSAAMNNAAQFQDQTKAILVGQTIGERPNSYQEPRQFRLPNSHLVVRVSTLWYAFRKTGPNVVAPDKAIIPTWDDVKAGRDPVLDWVLAQPAAARP